MYASSHNNVMNSNGSNYVLFPAGVRITRVATRIKSVQLCCCKLVASVRVPVRSCFGDCVMIPVICRDGRTCALLFRLDRLH